jgi:nitroreductase
MKHQFMNKIFERQSYTKIGSDMPNTKHIETILKSGMCANDHGRLTPWEFRVFKGEARAKLSEIFIKHEKTSGSSESLQNKAKDLAFSAPLIFCVSSKYAESKITKKDQLLSVGAACQLMTLSAHILGYASIWRSGKYSESEIVKESLDIKPNDDIFGFIYVGSILEQKPYGNKYHKGNVIQYV